MRDTETIAQQLAELMRQWEIDPQNVDLSRRLANLWGERYEQVQDAETLNGAVWYAHHLNLILNGSDPAVVRKLADLQLKQSNSAIKKLEADIQIIEEWVTSAGVGHEQESKYHELLYEMKRDLAELKSEHQAEPPQMLN